METQQEIDILAAAIYRDKVLRARARTMDEKLRDGMECFDLSCRLMADGVRHQFKLTDEAAVWKIVRERLALLRRIERSDTHLPAPVS